MLMRIDAHVETSRQSFAAIVMNVNVFVEGSLSCLETDLSLLHKSVSRFNIINILKLGEITMKKVIFN